MIHSTCLTYPHGGVSLQTAVKIVIATMFFFLYCRRVLVTCVCAEGVVVVHLKFLPSTSLILMV